ncbi:polysaccharide deacetylase family protein [Lentibacillus halophilus]|uniref:Polysaccharide deacetylase family protein n=1 Tax=Lentibacillus halophilus TaxID=295065 RepID=A0ABN0ZEE8_9BACI
MHHYRGLVHVCVFVLIVFASFGNSYNPFQTNEAKTFSQTVSKVAKQEDALYQKIKRKRSSYEAEPENAVIHKVWKKMPGINGLKVNVSQSYEQMKEEGGFDETLLTYEQIPPEISMDDLPSAPIYRGHPEKNMVALLFNVSWGGKYIPSILTTLKETGVKATFFIEGKWAKTHSDYVKMIKEQGHSIGNHAYNHPDMARLSNEETGTQLTRTNEILKAITGDMPKWFAPPSGSYSEQTVTAASKKGLNTILWTVDTIDWKNPSLSVMMNRVMNNIHPGATVLMHPTPSVAKNLDPLIARIKDKGYKLGTIDELLNEERPHTLQ